MGQLCTRTPKRSLAPSSQPPHVSGIPHQNFVPFGVKPYFSRLLFEEAGILTQHINFLTTSFSKFMSGVRM